MNKIIRNISILLLPFIVMVVINEVMKNSSKDGSFEKRGIKTINTVAKLKSKCSWYCYGKDNIEFCKLNHVKMNHKYFSFTDPLYNGIIDSLDATGDYWLANIFFLVFLIPFSIWLFIVKSFNVQDQLVKSKRGIK